MGLGVSEGLGFRVLITFIGVGSQETSFVIVGFQGMP